MHIRSPILSHYFSKDLAAILIFAVLISLNGCQKSQSMDIGAAKHHRINLTKLEAARLNRQLMHTDHSLATTHQMPQGQVTRQQATEQTKAFAEHLQRQPTQLHPTAQQTLTEDPPVNWLPNGQTQLQAGKVVHDRQFMGSVAGSGMQSRGSTTQIRNVTQPLTDQSQSHRKSVLPSEHYEVVQPASTHNLMSAWHQPLDDAMKKQWSHMSEDERAASERLLAAVFSLRPITAGKLKGDEALLKFIAAIRKELASGNQLSPEMIKSINEKIIGKSSFRIRKVAVCKRVRSYGVYEPFDSNTLLAGQNHPMILYAEIDDFQVLDTQDQMKEVLLEQSVAIHKEIDGLKVWAEKPVQIRDHSRNHRRDFFVVQKVTIPANLGVGRYRMKVTIQDIHGKQFDEMSIPVTVVAQPSLTHRPAVTSHVHSTGSFMPKAANQPSSKLIGQSVYKSMQSGPKSTRELPLGYSAVSLYPDN